MGGNSTHEWSQACGYAFTLVGLLQAISVHPCSLVHRLSTNVCQERSNFRQGNSSMDRGLYHLDRMYRNQPHTFYLQLVNPVLLSAMEILCKHQLVALLCHFGLQ
jgi:hypothetical protein